MNKTTKFQLQAKTRLLAADTSDPTSDQVQNQPPVEAGVDEDSAATVRSELEQAKERRASAVSRGATGLVSRYDALIEELERASTPVVESNSTYDFEGLSTSDPSRDTLMIEPDPESPEAELQSAAADDISNGDAYDLMMDGDPRQEEPVVQELTNDDGGIEPPTDQALLKDDVPPGPPVL